MLSPRNSQSRRHCHLHPQLRGAPPASPVRLATYSRSNFRILPDPRYSSNQMDNVLPSAEQAKLDANFLRGTLADELKNSSYVFTKAATGVLKFHGPYQQDDR